MTRIIILILSISLISPLIHSQTPKSICVKPGISTAYMHNNDGKTYTYPGSFYVGVNLEFMQHKYFSILTEMGFATKSDHFVYISPLFKARMEFGKFIPYVYAGPRLDFPLTTYSQRQAGYIEKFNFCVFGLSYGVGLELMFWPFGWVLGFQHQYDISNVLNESKINPENINYNHSTLIFSIGMKAYFGKRE